MAEERDFKVSQRYRELGSDEPPRELDEAILRAARRANDRPHAPLVTPAGRHRWYYVFGAAAIMVLAVAVTVQIERQRPDPELVPDAPVPVEPPKAESGFARDPAPNREAPSREPARDAAPETAAQARSPVQENTTAEAQKPEARAESASRPMAAPAAPAESRSDESVLGAASSSRESKMKAPQPPQAPATAATSPPGAAADSAGQPMPAPAARARMAEQAAEPPERWLERIVQLRKEGRHEEAEKQLAEFRKRYPDYKVPESALK
jgi:hypothetical protein